MKPNKYSVQKCPHSIKYINFINMHIVSHDSLASRNPKNQTISKTRFLNSMEHQLANDGLNQDEQDNDYFSKKFIKQTTLQSEKNLRKYNYLHAE